MNEGSMNPTKSQDEGSGFFSKLGNYFFGLTSSEEGKTLDQDPEPFEVSEEELEAIGHDNEVIINSKKFEEIRENDQKLQGLMTSEEIENNVLTHFKDVTSHQVEDMTSHQVEDMMSHQVNLMTSHQVDDMTSHQVDDMTLHPVEDMTSHQVDDMTSHQVEDMTSHQVDDMTSHQVEGMTSHQVDNMTSHQVDDMTSLEAGDSAGITQKMKTFHVNDIDDVIKKPSIKKPKRSLKRPTTRKKIPSSLSIDHMSTNCLPTDDVPFQDFYSVDPFASRSKLQNSPPPTSSFLVNSKNEKVDSPPLEAAENEVRFCVDWFS